MPKLRNKRDVCLYVMKTCPFMFDTYSPTIRRTLRNRRSIKRKWSVFSMIRYRCKHLGSDY